jgi:hypothetical protein
MSTLLGVLCLFGAAAIVFCVSSWLIRLFLTVLFNGAAAAFRADADAAARRADADEPWR